jgi:hypothetical protein
LDGNRVNQDLLYRGEISEKKIVSLYQSRVTAGFPAGVIRKELYPFAHKEVPDVDAA